MSIALGRAARPKASRNTVKVRADGETPASIRIAFPGIIKGPFNLKLSKGSFSPDEVVREMPIHVSGGVMDVLVYPPGYPTTGYLTGPGVRVKLVFTPKNLAQKLLLEWLPIAAGSFLFTLLLRTYAFASFFIPTSSMADTIAVGDLVLAWNFSYQILGERPQRGDIITFDHPNATHETWIKRVIGLPGETVEVNRGKLLIDGREYHEDYLKDTYIDYFGPLTVPEGCYFVLGDNRYDSSDSRYWGMLPEHQISGQAKLVYWPPAHARWIKNDMPR